MNQSFYTGISGVKSHQYSIDVLSNNIANINTTGYKESRPEFSTILSNQLTGTVFDPLNSDIGVGTQIDATTKNFKQGALVKTEGTYDLAINGVGWFGMLDDQGNKFFTRVGTFNPDATGHLVDMNGNYLTGTLSDNIVNNQVKQDPSDEVILSDPYNQTKIKLIDDLTYPSKPTTNIKIKGNLDPEKILEFSPKTEKKEEVPNLEIFKAISITNKDQDNKLELSFKKEVPQAKEGIKWNVEAIITGEDGDIIGEPQTGVVTFDSKGALLENTLKSINNDGNIVTLDFGKGYEGLVSMSDVSASRKVEKDGYPGGKLQEYDVDEEGQVIAIFDNAQVVPIAKIATYHFQNQEGLESASTTYFQESENSGKATFLKNKDGQPAKGSIIHSRMLESSNVSLSKTLSELIVMQKAFDASSKSITTSDQMVQNAIQMKK